MTTLALNPEQREAVEHPAGPLLVLAGAGSGKTRVLTARVARLIEQGVAPDRILAVTFTNKAAGEMRERIEGLIGRSTRGLWIGTFHSVAARLLRRESVHTTRDRSFTIYDEDDSVRALKDVMERAGYDPKRWSPRAVRHRISSCKNALVGPAEYAVAAYDLLSGVVSDVYPAYQELLARRNAYDFDDLLFETVGLLEGDGGVGERYAARFEHVLVDEYQDTNRAQYRMVKALAARHGNLCVVGDDDQSIYGWRGADLRNILDFERDFPGAHVVRLEQNYRSTAAILEVANAVIACNVDRKPKRLRTERERGDPIGVVRCGDERHEAAWAAREIERARHGHALDDFAVLYRTNAQSRAFEEAFRRAGLAYRIVGGVPFYERREIKDVLAYLQLLVNPADDVAARRVVNTPRRGIGAKTEQVLSDVALRERTTFLEACRRAEEHPQLGPRAVSSVLDFVAIIGRLGDAVGQRPLPELVELVWTATGYLDELEAQRTIEAQGRIENIKELASVAADFVSLQPDATLAEFLERIALISEADALDDDGDGPQSRLVLMTMHNAKGLEYPVVFVIGMEDSVFPHHRALSDPDELEEERRLCYVAFTRARERLYVTSAWSRTLFGATNANPPSRILREIPPELLEVRRDQGGPSRRVAAREDADDGDEFAVGMRVLHPRFGQGRILELSGTPGSQEAVITFDESGTKRMLLTYAPLIRV